MSCQSTAATGAPVWNHLMSWAKGISAKVRNPVLYVKTPHVFPSFRRLVRIPACSIAGPMAAVCVMSLWSAWIGFVASDDGT